LDERTVGARHRDSDDFLRAPGNPGNERPRVGNARRSPRRRIWQSANQRRAHHGGGDGTAAGREPCVMREAAGRVPMQRVMARASQFREIGILLLLLVVFFGTGLLSPRYL